MTIEATPVTQPPVSDDTCSDQLVIRAGIKQVDGCPALTKMRGYIVDQMVQATLEWQFLGTDGKPLDINDSDTQSAHDTLDDGRNEG